MADPGSARVEVERVRALAKLLDTAVRVPGTDISLGLDPILGLVPGLGDVAGAALSGYIVYAAARLGAPTSVVSRMLLNIGIDTIVGGIPLLGDLFDVAWKSNAKNAVLLERHLADPRATRRASAGVMALAIGGVVLFAAVGVVIAVATVRWIAGLF
jgi:hypothetical protein